MGQDQVKPVEAKVEAMPPCKRQLMRFLILPVIAENSVIMFLSLLSH